MRASLRRVRRADGARDASLAARPECSRRARHRPKGSQQPAASRAGRQSAYVPGLMQLRQPLPEHNRIDGDRHGRKQAIDRRARKSALRLPVPECGEKSSDSTLRALSMSRPRRLPRDNSWYSLGLASKYTPPHRTPTWRPASIYHANTTLVRTYTYKRTLGSLLTGHADVHDPPHA